jgi:hypothetical protein
MRTLLDRQYLIGGDGTFDPTRDTRDTRAGYGHEVDYHLADTGHALLTDFGVTLPARRAVVRYCVDWSEQRHHLAGAAGRGLLTRPLQLNWIRRAPANRAVHITDTGHAGLLDTFNLKAG